MLPKREWRTEGLCVCSGLRHGIALCQAGSGLTLCRVLYGCTRVECRMYTQVHIHYMAMGVGCPRLYVPIRRKFCDRYGGRANTLVRYADRDASASHEQAAQEHCEHIRQNLT